MIKSPAYVGGSVITLDASAAEQFLGSAMAYVSLGEKGTVLSVTAEPQWAPKLPPLWFVEVRESTAQPPAVNLVAFTGDAAVPGALLDQTAVSNLPVRSEDQVGAVRWYPATGEVDQVYVQPDWRRRQVGATLLAAGELVSVARDWPRLWGDGQRTELGELMRNGRTWRERWDELTHLHPPMTPS